MAKSAASYFDMTAEDLIPDQQFYEILEKVEDNWNVVFTRVDGGWKHVVTKITPPKRDAPDGILITALWVADVFENASGVKECKRILHTKLEANTVQLKTRMQGMCDRVRAGRKIRLMSSVMRDDQKEAFVAAMKYLLGEDAHKLKIEDGG